jgi:Ca2+-binding EF-hand superfamily protein
MNRPLLLLLTAAAVTACQSTSTPPDRFVLADADKDGRLSRAEVSDFVVHNVFDARDEDGNHRLTPTEWWPEQDAEQTQAFTLRDANADSIVTLEEALVYGRANQGWDDIMADADTNKDGFITREEGTAYYAAREGPIR